MPDDRETVELALGPEAACPGCDATLSGHMPESASAPLRGRVEHEPGCTWAAAHVPAGHAIVTVPPPTGSVRRPGRVIHTVRGGA